jgi:glutamate--cysteine ligase regulatory subunit
LNHAETALEDDRTQYDITVKLFFLPGTSGSNRSAQIREAVALVLKALSMPSIDLLILSFPGIYFDEEEDCPDKLSTRGPIEVEPEPLEEQMPIWKTLEDLHSEGIVTRLGIAEFGRDRLEALLSQATIKPSVDQINLRDCCSVPQDLLAFAKSASVELLVHNDSSNILPRGITRELLGDGPSGAGVLVDSSKAGDKRKNLHDEKDAGTADGPLIGELFPQWVVKYTAVVKDRGVVESKGYFAVASLDQ